MDIFWNSPISFRAKSPFKAWKEPGKILSLTRLEIFSKLKTQANKIKAVDILFTPLLQELLSLWIQIVGGVVNYFTEKDETLTMILCRPCLVSNK